jgi:hypothetical protein
MNEWEDALDALEEWVRRTATELARPTPSAPGAAPLLPPGQVPGALALRAQLLASAMRNAETDLLRRREQLRREQAYGAA